MSVKSPWLVELVTDTVVCNDVELEATHIVKIDHHTLLVDGVRWVLPPIKGMSFARVEKEAKRAKEIGR